MHQVEHNLEFVKTESVVVIGYSDGYQVPETWVFGFWKCHGEMGVKIKLNKTFLQFLPNFCHNI